MVRTVKATSKPTPNAAKRPSGRQVNAAEKASAKTAKSPAVAKHAPVVKAAAQTPGKQELLAQVDTLARTNASLRAKQQEANRTTKAIEARIAELEGRIVGLETQVASLMAPAKRPRATRKSREIDPGDAVPPGVAVQEPQPLDEEAATALDNLQDHLGAQ